MLKTVNTDVFNEDVLNFNGLSVVDFWAEWCGPCKALNPVLLSLSEKYPSVNFVKVNVEEENALAGQYGVTSLPAILFLKDGIVVKQLTGFANESKLEEVIKEIL